MSFSLFRLTGEQIRAARALARIEQSNLASRTGLSLETIKRLERVHGPVDANVRTLNAIVSAFEELGVLFDGCEEGGVGVCRPPPTSKRPREFSRERRQADSNAGGHGDGAHPLYRLIYHSVSRVSGGGALRDTLADIDDRASQRNIELGVTGALFACNGRFLQVLEGPKEAVQLAFGAISVDSRHSDLQIVESRAVNSRQFADWGVCCGVFPSDRIVLGREPAMEDRFQPELLSPASALGLLTMMRDLQGEQPRLGRGDFRWCGLASECLDRTCAEGSLSPD